MRISPKTQIAFGLTLNLLSWAVAWTGPEPVRYHTFFPLWLGVIVAIDGVTRWISGSSLFQRAGFRFVWLFAFSIPIWWIFEAANHRLENWVYVLPRDYSWLQYHAEASLAFATVAPAIFVMTEFVGTVLIKKPVRWIRIDPTHPQLMLISSGGLALFAATMLWPAVLFPFVWISLFLTVDPVVRLLGGTSISGAVSEGRWELVLRLFAGTLLCGLFWEFWNFWSMPKWTYQIPYADWFRVFEMPILGYGGYLPFGLEVFALVALADRLLGTGLMRSVRFVGAKGDRDSGQRSYAVRANAD